MYEKWINYFPLILDVYIRIAPIVCNYLLVLKLFHFNIMLPRLILSISLLNLFYWKSLYPRRMVSFIKFNHFSFCSVHGMKSKMDILYIMEMRISITEHSSFSVNYLIKENNFHRLLINFESSRILINSLSNNLEVINLIINFI